MSGHSKWSQIKRKKGINDVKKGLVFSKLSKAITLAVIEGGGITDPNLNASLRIVVEKAKKENMPKDNIKRAIEKGTGSNKSQLKQIIYEGFAPFNIPFIAVATTDNTNRTLADLRHTVEKAGGKLANPGAVSYLFKKNCLVVFDKNETKEEDVFNFADKLGSVDIDQNENEYFVYLPFEKLGQATESLKGKQFKSINAIYRPTSPINIPSEDEYNKLTSFVDLVEGLEDIEKVFLALK